MTEQSQPHLPYGSPPKFSDAFSDVGTVITSPASLVETADSSASSCMTCRDLESQTSANVTHSAGRLAFLQRLRTLDIRPKLPFWISRFLGYRPDGIFRPIWALRWLETFNVPLVVEEYVTNCFCTLFGLICVIMINTMTAFSSLPIPLSLGSAGALSIILFLTPHSPAAAPRNVIFSHLFASVLATLIAKLFLTDARAMVIVEDQMAKQTVWVWACVSVTLTMLFQKAFNVIHPPAGGTALLGTIQPNLIRIGWTYVGFVMSSVTVMVGVALVFGNIGRRSYPGFWFTAPPPTPSINLPPQTAQRGSKSKETEGSSTYTTSEASSRISYQSAKSSKESLSIESISASAKSSLNPSLSVQSFHEKNTPLSNQPSSNLSIATQVSPT